MDSNEATAALQESQPLLATLGAVAGIGEAGAVVIELEWGEHLTTLGGALHGGTIMAIADAAGGTCAYMNLPEGSVGTSTIESKTNFIGAVREGTLVATARPLHVGKTTIVVETELMCGGRLVAKTTQTQTVLRPRV